MLEQVDGVIVALPSSEDNKVLVHTEKSGALTEDSAKRVLEESGEFKVTAFAATEI